MSGFILRRLAAAALVAMAGCSPHRPEAAPSATPTSTPLPAASVSAIITSSPIATATPVAAHTPKSTTAPSQSPLVLAPDAGPKILGIKLSTTQFDGGDVVSGMVRTSSNVASVEARIATYGITVPKTGVGRFELSYRVPDVPFFLHGNYMMQFIARNARGDRAERDIPISIH